MSFREKQHGLSQSYQIEQIEHLSPAGPSPNPSYFLLLTSCISTLNPSFSTTHILLTNCELGFDHSNSNNSNRKTFLKHLFYKGQHACMINRFSLVRLFGILWTVARQAPLSMGVSTQEYWSGLPFPSPEGNARHCSKCFVLIHLNPTYTSIG